MTSQYYYRGFCSIKSILSGTRSLKGSDGSETYKLSDSAVCAALSHLWKSLEFTVNMGNSGILSAECDVLRKLRKTSREGRPASPTWAVREGVIGQVGNKNGMFMCFV